MRTLQQLVDAVAGIELAVATPPLEDGCVLDRVTFDSREVGPGALFVAMKGSRADGHKFLDDVIRRGASAVLIDDDSMGLVPPLPDSCALLLARDTREVLGELAAAFFGHPCRDLRMIGLTGTNGKTTTSYILEAILRAAHRKTGVIGTVNYRWNDHVEPAANTTPESLVMQRLSATMVADQVTDLVVEVSSHGLSTHRLNGALFDVGVFTNLSQDHLDFHGTMESYRDAKRRLFLELLPAGKARGKEPRAVLNVDDQEGRALAEILGSLDSVKVVTYSVSDSGAQIYCRAIDESITGSRLSVVTEAGEFDVDSPLLGRFNVSNSLAAIGAALAVGVNVDAIVEGFTRLVGVPGRLERVGVGVGVSVGAGGPAVFVDYAHTPDALERALETLRPLVKGRLVVVFGCGGDRDRGKRPLMGEVAARLADVVVITSDNPRTEAPAAIVDEIHAGVRARLLLAEETTLVRTEVDRRRAIRAAIAEASGDDVVLIAGKGHENYQEIEGHRHAFDDVHEAMQALKERSQS